MKIQFFTGRGYHEISFLIEIRSLPGWTVIIRHWVITHCVSSTQHIVCLHLLISYFKKENETICICAISVRMFLKKIIIISILLLDLIRLQKCFFLFFLFVLTKFYIILRCSFSASDYILNYIAIRYFWSRNRSNYERPWVLLWTQGR